MNSKGILLRSWPGRLLTITVLMLLIGCQPSAKVQTVAPEEKRPVFFPPPPNKPRLQFLTSYSKPIVVESKKKSSFKDFIVGEKEEEEIAIELPYGVEIHDGKIYVCDIVSRQILILNPEGTSFKRFPLDRRVEKPTNIFIDSDEMKYIADLDGRSIFVYDKNNNLISIFGRDQGLDIAPLDVLVRGQYLFLTDVKYAQIVILDKQSGELIRKIGKKATSREEFDANEELFLFTNDLDLDVNGNIYVTDKIKAQVTKFDASGEFVRTYSGRGGSAGSLARPKGIALDKKGRIWVVDAGPAEAVKVFGSDGQFLLFFGLSGNDPGMMNLPATIDIDYDNIAYFQKYAVDGAQLEFLVLVTNQYGPHKVTVYGFGSFPQPEPVEQSPALPESEAETKTETKTETESETETSTPSSSIE